MTPIPRKRRRVLAVSVTALVVGVLGVAGVTNALAATTGSVVSSANGAKASPKGCRSAAATPVTYRPRRWAARPRGPTSMTPQPTRWATEPAGTSSPTSSSAIDGTSTGVRSPDRAAGHDLGQGAVGPPTGLAGSHGHGTACPTVISLVHSDTPGS